MIKLLAAIYAAYNQACLNDSEHPWYPRNGETFCNFVVNFVCNTFGYTKFNAGSQNTPVMANAMVTFMQTSSDWMSVSGDVASVHANAGALVIAAELNPAGHGHVAVLCGGEPEYSGHFAKNTPLLMNVGETVFIGKHAGFAFQTEPVFYVLISTIPNQGA